VLHKLHRFKHAAPPVVEGPRFFTTSGLDIDFVERRIRAGTKIARLTPKEAEVLQYLVLQEGRAVPHRELLEAVWGPNSVNHRNYLHVLITNLRKKIETDPSKPQYILTESWFGYSFSVPKL
jgi:two-component system KDP operon response regulator KdpE